MASDAQLALLNAIMNGEAESLEEIVRRGADVNAVGPQAGDTPLVCAAQCGETKCVTELERLGADVNWAEPSLGFTAIHFASRHGHVAVVRELARLGANVNAEDRAHRAPLHSAAVHGHTLTAMDLVRLGADMKATNEEGSTPLKLANAYRVLYGHSETVDCLEKLMKERQLKNKQLKPKNKSKPEYVEARKGIPDKSDGKPLFVGATVEMHSLEAAGLNGQNGKLVEWNASKERWHLELMNGRELVVKAKNLRRVILDHEQHRALFGLEPLRWEPTAAHVVMDAAGANQKLNKTVGCTHAQCGKIVSGSLPHGSGLLLCSRCKSVAYCGKQCQKSAWKIHKHQCGALRMHMQERGLKRALGMAKQPAPYTAKQQGLIDKIRALFSQERWEELNRMDVNEVLEVAEELRCQKTQQDACHPAVGMLLLLARSFESVSRHSEAIGLTEKAKAFASDVGDQVGLKDSARDLGIFYSKVGRYNDAINVHYVAMAIALRMGLRDEQGHSIKDLGFCYQQLKEYDRAMIMFEEALAIHQFQPADHADVLNSKGDCCRHLGRHDMAVTHHKQAWDLLKQDADQPGNAFRHTFEQTRAALLVGAALWAKAQVLLHDAPPDFHGTVLEAEKWLRTAQDLGVKHGLPATTRNSQLLLAYVVLAKGDKNSENEAVDLLLQHLNGWMVQSTSMKKFCAGCMQERIGDKMLKCSKCLVARFCSVSCQKMASNKQSIFHQFVRHKHICPLLEQFRSVWEETVASTDRCMNIGDNVTMYFHAYPLSFKDDMLTFLKRRAGVENPEIENPASDEEESEAFPDSADHLITSFERAISLLHTRRSGSEKSTIECYLGDLLNHTGK